MDEMAAHLEFWQKALRLQDWDIDFKVVRLKEWLAAGKTTYTAGCCSMNGQNAYVVVRILDPEDLADDVVPSYRDAEVTIVHELLHILIPVSASDGSDVHGERAINRIAEALVTLRRMKTP